ncbi:hypothetical protein MLD38_008525 [Melastoma candidum]|uniref:Uncharacterized protein n=1 Tax=Melastoma candidum TaxID=119954 RepID=A0ACB9RU11_9MYRT|nr:hypothetical protein MLD38_008525 [Melastoma candidum]
MTLVVHLVDAATGDIRIPRTIHQLVEEGHRKGIERIDVEVRCVAQHWNDVTIENDLRRGTSDGETRQGEGDDPRRDGHRGVIGWLVDMAQLRECTPTQPGMIFYTLSVGTQLAGSFWSE